MVQVGGEMQWLWDSFVLILFNLPSTNVPLSLSLTVPSRKWMAIHGRSRPQSCA